jgi:hypothetical protein
MKRLFALAALWSFPLLMMAQDRDHQDKDHFRFTQSGEFANFSQFTPPFTVVNLQVSRGSNSTSGNSASLQYTVISEPADFSSITVTNVFGPIPSGAFTGVTTHDLVLNIDTSTLDPTTFASETCTTDFTTFTQTCVPGPVGLIQLEFQENGAQRTIVDLKQTTFSGPVTTHLRQKSDNSTANVQGSVFGVQVTGAPANVGVNHQSTLEITHD